MLPDRSFLVGQKLVENANIEIFKWDILSHFQTLWRSWLLDMTMGQTHIAWLLSNGVSNIDYFCLASHRVCYSCQLFFLVAVAVNFACLGRDVWCSIALYCSFFFTIAVTMRSNWGGSNNPFPFHLLSIIVVIIIISLQVDDYYNKTAGKKGYRAFSLSLCNHNNHLPWYCRAAQTTNAEARITKNNVS